mmetsp:Transcript_67196/g.194316  ORF Transcript_67196/g.194316 Transcript_67196/m.194316 type:complete len:245 (-) Transcript_67196:368-1102(-)
MIASAPATLRRFGILAERQERSTACRPLPVLRPSAGTAWAHCRASLADRCAAKNRKAMATTAKMPEATARPTTAKRNPDVVTSLQAYGRKRVGLFRFSPSASSDAIAANAQAATTPTVGSGRLGSIANPATTRSTAARASTAMPSKVAGLADEASASTLMFSALAATIQPRCTAKGRRSSQYSSVLKAMLSVTSAMPTRPTRMPNMQTTDNQMTSCAKTMVQQTWKPHAANHHGVEARTTSRPR